MAALSTKKSRTFLSLKKKVEVIRTAEKDHSLTLRSLGEIFQWGKTQIAKILKKKDSILSLYEANASSSALHMRESFRRSKFDSINEALYQWYLLACSRNIFVGGPILVEKGKEIARRLGVDDFKGSNGWLEKWKKRYNLRQVRVCGESGDVSGETVESWKERLPEIVEGFTAEDIWNIDETGCLWQALPDKGFCTKGQACKGGKKSKLRVTVALIANAAGGTEKPVVIYRSEKPRCFKGIEKSQLPVQYHNQPNSWMTSKILETVLSKLNRKLSAQKRSILLFLDNAGCHPKELMSKFTNIKIVFLPPNTTAKLQPLDLGIIQNFKIHYRSLLLHYVLAKIEESSSAKEIVKSVNVLTAIRWIAQAWDSVKPETIVKCFRKSGMLSEALVAVSRETGDVFDDLDFESDSDAADHALELKEMISQTFPASQFCSADEYVNAEDDLPVCREFDEDWEKQFLGTIAEEFQNETEDAADNMDDDDDEVEEIVSPKIKGFKQAMDSLEDVKVFLQLQGCSEEASTVAGLVDKVAKIKRSRLQQCSIMQFVVEQ
ncbi:tigger transposable element-derived protein 4-like [Oscarella lobularis]|uniref:tigger transposable element-derived protein 4-like n=1 Tax=Oscarella lobularis TaxID=121494 RepID=UPI0033136A3E